MILEIGILNKRDMEAFPALFLGAWVSSPARRCRPGAVD